MLTKIGGDITTCVNHPYFAYFLEFLSYNEITGKIKQLYLSVCGNSRIVLGSEIINIFYCFQAAK